MPFVNKSRFKGQRLKVKERQSGVYQLSLIWSLLHVPFLLVVVTIVEDPQQWLRIPQASALPKIPTRSQTIPFQSHFNPNT